MKAEDLKFFENKPVAVQLKTMLCAVLPKRTEGGDPLVDELEVGEDGGKLEFGHPAMVLNNGQPAAVPVLSGYIVRVPECESIAAIETDGIDNSGVKIQVVVSIDEIAAVNIIPDPPKANKIVS